MQGTTSNRGLLPKDPEFISALARELLPPSSSGKAGSGGLEIDDLEREQNRLCAAEEPPRRLQGLEGLHRFRRNCDCDNTCNKYQFRVQLFRHIATALGFANPQKISGALRGRLIHHDSQSNSTRSLLTAGPFLFVGGDNPAIR